MFPVPPNQWSWNTHFGPEDGPAFSVSNVQCAFVWGPRGAEKIVNCDVEGLPDEDGTPQARAVQAMCPECESPFRLSPEKAPFAVGEKVIQFERYANDPEKKHTVKYRPLTVFIPVACNSDVAAYNSQGEVIGTGKCDWNVVIRRGRAYPMDTVRATLPRAIQTAQEAWAYTAQQIKSREGRQDFSQWKAVLQQIWQEAMPCIQRIQSGQYERSGKLSLVGCWDQLDYVIETCRQMLKQLGIQV